MIIFVPININYKSTTSIRIEKIAAKNWSKRLYWETFGLLSWLSKQEISPALYISLQNNGLFFKHSIKNLKQIIYYHQSIPFETKLKIYPLKKLEYKMWFYKYVYPYIVRMTVRSNWDSFVVQTQWMKDAMKEHYLFKNFNVKIYKPEIRSLEACYFKKSNNKNKFNVFYPAFDYRYKNHALLIDIVSELIINRSPLLENLQFIITLENSSRFYNMVSEFSYQKYFKFVGILTSDEVYQYYFDADLLIFTSLLESFGLPLLEASQTGIQILSINKSYANEVLDGYDGVLYANQDDVSDWARKLEIFANNIKRYPPFVPNYCTGWKEFIEFISMETVI